MRRNPLRVLNINHTGMMPVSVMLTSAATSFCGLHNMQGQRHCFSQDSQMHISKAFLGSCSTMPPARDTCASSKLGHQSAGRDMEAHRRPRQGSLMCRQARICAGCWRVINLCSFWSCGEQKGSWPTKLYMQGCRRGCRGTKQRQGLCG